MLNNRFIVQSFGLFFRYRPVRLVTLFLISLFLGFNQGITIVLLIPLLEMLDPARAAASPGKWGALLHSLFGRLGLEVNLTLILLLFTFSLLAIAVLTYYQSVMQAAYQQGFSYETRRRLFRKIVACDWIFLNGKSKYNHIQILTAEIPKMTTYYYFYLGLASKVIFIVTHVLLALAISVKFTVFVALTGMAVFFSLRRYLKNAEHLGAVNVQAFRKMLQHIDEFWMTVKMAKVHNTEAFYFQKFEEANKLMLDQQFRQIKNRAVPQLLFMLAGTLTLVVVVYSAYGVAKLPLTALFVLILLFARIFPQFAGVNGDINMLVSNVESVRMVLALDNEIKERDFEKKQEPGRLTLNYQLEIRNLHFAYDPAMQLFSDFSVSIPAKKITGIVGKSGCGKTTLIDLLAGLQRPSGGGVWSDGEILSDDRLPAWRNGLGYLPQDSFFVDGTIRENLIWDSGRQLSDEQIFEVLSRVKADQLITGQPKGLDSYIANYQFHFSGGERQRLALARVLIRQPQLLLLDEATSALDAGTEAQIMECLTALKQQVTIVFVTHRQTLRHHFDKIVDLTGEPVQV